jgi:hypothetical protein
LLFGSIVFAEIEFVERMVLDVPGHPIGLIRTQVKLCDSLQGILNVFVFNNDVKGWRATPAKA